MTNKTEGSIAIQAETLKRVLFALGNQIKIFGNDEDTRHALELLQDDIDGHELAEVLLADMNELHQAQENTERTLAELSLVERVQMTMVMKVSDQDLEQYGGLPEVTAMGPLKNVSKSIIKTSAQDPGNGEASYNLIYHVDGDVDFDLIERLVSRGIRLSSKTLFGIEVTSPYWDPDNRIEKTIKIEIE